MTVGLWGLGATGLATLKRLQPFGCKLIVSNRSEFPDTAEEYGFKYVDFETLVTKSDVLSLHTPLNGSTRHTLNETRLRQMKANAYLINVARAALVDLSALYRVLEDGHLSGVGFDVLTHEAVHLSKERICEIATDPSKAGDAQCVLLERLLMQHPRVMITPHTAYYTESSLKAMTQQSVENIEAFIQGNYLRRVI